MKKVIIIGGGIAGLTAGIYAQKNGFSTEIYEKNTVLGGECTGWNRQGYHIDNCIHWLTGCRSEDELCEIWRTTGALDDTTALYHEPYFYQLEMNNTVLHFWRDIEKARKEFLTTAPEDSVEINRFFDNVKKAECVKVPCQKSLAEMSFLEYMKFGMSMAEMGSVIREYGNDTVADLANRFQNPYVKEMMRRYYNNTYKATALISSYAFYTSNTAAIPIGGSVGMVQRIVKRYKELGGRIYTNMPAVKIAVSGKRAESVSFADGNTVSCDYVICAADPAVIFGSLIDKKYMDKKLRTMYARPDGYHISSGFNVSFGIIGEAECGGIKGSVVYPCDAFTVGRTQTDFMCIRLYDYDETLFPKNKRVLQCNILQDRADYEYWNGIYKDRERYQAEKQRIAEEAEARIVSHYPCLKNRLILLSTYSPVTFTKWCGAYQGSYMSFFEQKGYKSLTAKNSVKGLSNVFIASQWLTTNGGLPIAAASGKFAADKLRSAAKSAKGSAASRKPRS